MACRSRRTSSATISRSISRRRLEFSDTQALAFAHEKIRAAERLLGRTLKIPDDLILRHYHNRGILPFEIAQNLSEEQHDQLKGKLPAAMMLRPIYIRVYPNGRTRRTYHRLQRQDRAQSGRRNR